MHDRPIKLALWWVKASDSFAYAAHHFRDGMQSSYRDVRPVSSCRSYCHGSQTCRLQNSIMRRWAVYNWVPTNSSTCLVPTTPSSTSPTCVTATPTNHSSRANRKWRHHLLTTAGAWTGLRTMRWYWYSVTVGRAVWSTRLRCRTSCTPARIKSPTLSERPTGVFQVRRLNLVMLRYIENIDIDRFGIAIFNRIGRLNIDFSTTREIAWYINLVVSVCLSVRR